MSHFDGLSDDFYVNTNLNTEMELPSARDSVLHFFERLQKQYPEMRNFYNRDRHEFVLEEDKDRGHYRWSSVEPRRISSGYVNPGKVADALEQHQLVLEAVPYMLSVSPLDCEALNVMYGFDFTYRGNQNQLVAEALGIVPAFERLMDHPGATVISNEPSIQFALDEECRVQCRLSIETRTSAFHVRTGDYPEDQLSVYITARRYGSLDPGETFVDVMYRLNEICEEFVNGYVVDNVLQPLYQTIAIK
ncbi:MAG: hypothetical protein MK179_10935 [Pirellulaceae bacterium]|nr:hypothetical protein [Pirellulaceae bacterium]